MAHYEVSSFPEFYNNILTLDNKIKGDIFEEFAEYYFTLKFGVRYYKLSEVPLAILNKLELDRRDVGIDAVYEEDGYIPVQVKFRQSKTLCYGELSTFYSILQDRPFNRRGAIITTAKEISLEPMRYIKLLCISYYNLVRDCDENFWVNLRRLRQNQNPIYIPKRPFPFQEVILRRVQEFFSKENKGRLISACGTGKTLLGLWISQRLNSYRTLIIVPSLVLLRQTYDVWKKEWPRKKFLLVGSERETPHGVIVTTDPIEISRSRANVIISTYHSVHLLENFRFSLILYDEAHHTKENISTFFTRSLRLNSKYKLFLTATGEELDRENHGPIIYEYNLQRGIEEERLTDYRVVICCVKGEAEAILEENKLITYEGKAIKPNLLKVITMIEEAVKDLNLSRTILYSNSVKIAKFVLEKVNLSRTKSLLTSKEKGNTRCAILEEFSKSPQAILSSVRVIKEGLDIDNCDSICFVEPRHSYQDIVQCIGRCLRKREGKDMAYIILPIVCDDLLSYSEKEYGNIAKVLSCLAGQDVELEKKIIVKTFSTYSISKPGNLRQGIEIDVDAFKRGIFLNIFSRHGCDDKAKVLLERENTRRYRKNKKLLVTRDKCCAFLGEEKEVDIWITYALTPSLFKEITVKYYKTIEEFVQACKKLDINYGNYKELYSQDEYLPPFYLLKGGLYKHLDEEFNLTLLLSAEDW